MVAHISCRPWSYVDDVPASCSVVCVEHDLRASFGRAHAVARAACIEHNTIHHVGERRAAVPLLSVIYASAASATCTESDLQDLLHRARTRNRAFGVTGMLLAEDGWFLQALEGPAPIVENLLQSIRRDPRHTRLHVLSQELRRERRFPDWAMAQGHIGDVESRPLAQYYEALLLVRARAES